MTLLYHGFTHTNPLPPNLTAGFEAPVAPVAQLTPDSRRTLRVNSAKRTRFKGALWG